MDVIREDPIAVKVITDNTDIRNALILAGISLAAAVAVVWMERKLSGPDAFLTIKMKCLTEIQDYADKRAAYWHAVARKAANAYLDSRPVS
jgi:hypothetical protein